MVIRRIKLAVFCFICFLLQGNVAQCFSIRGGVPDFILVFTLACTFLDDTDSPDVLIAAAAAGLLRDICYGQVVGISPLLYLSAGGLMLSLRRRLNNESRIMLFLVTALATVMMALGQWLLFAAFTQTFPDFFRELLRLPGNLLWNFLLLLVIRRIYERRRRRSRFLA